MKVVLDGMLLSIMFCFNGIVNVCINLEIGKCVCSGEEGVFEVFKEEDVFVFLFFQDESDSNGGVDDYLRQIF